MTDRIEVDYAQLDKMVQQLRGRNNDLEQDYRRLLGKFHELQEGWKGKGAEDFSAEIEDIALPAYRRLMSAISQIQTTLVQVAQVMRHAEEQGANLFKSGVNQLSLSNTNNVLGMTINRDNLLQANANWVVNDAREVALGLGNHQLKFQVSPFDENSSLEIFDHNYQNGIFSFNANFPVVSRDGGISSTLSGQIDLRGLENVYNSLPQEIKRVISDAKEGVAYGIENIGEAMDNWNKGFVELSSGDIGKGIGHIAGFFVDGLQAGFAIGEQAFGFFPKLILGFFDAAF